MPPANAPGWQRLSEGQALVSIREIRGCLFFQRSLHMPYSSQRAEVRDILRWPLQSIGPRVRQYGLQGVASQYPLKLTP